MIIDNIFSIIAFIIRQKRFPNLMSPKSLTDKILLIKLKQQSKISYLRKLAADRIAVRDYVKSKSKNCNLIKMLWSGSELKNSDWESLPDKFVIKANHGSKMVKIVDKSKDSFKYIYDLTQEWLVRDYYKRGREWVYKDTPRTLIVEELLQFSDKVPPDFKFFCLNGKVSFVQVDLDRFNGHCRNIYSNRFDLLDVEYHFPRGYSIKKPSNFEDAVKISEELSSDFDFVRVDLYLLDDGIFFGELTNFPGNCLESFDDYSFDLEVGSKLVLNHD
ncbi:ATP-grasp fold amidoligase family protein [Vibrio parahaemolyticus]|nr:ATP-grasp fold amidoligase family protein [Vibrio parahaemolyticus]MDF4449770.1 ATP-grasp fold amidoligase family protein [Vibrio parahaemolyticus]